MPVTKTAKRALRVTVKKTSVKKAIISRLEEAVRLAKKAKSPQKIKRALSLADKAAKSKAIHKNKAGRIKSALSKLAKPATKKSPKK